MRYSILLGTIFVHFSGEILLGDENWDDEGRGRS